MTVFLLIREDQNEHGYVDTSVDGVFQDEADAKARELAEVQRALDAGLLVEDENCADADWQVCWRIEPHPVG
jgi:hypothetical protein